MRVLTWKEASKFVKVADKRGNWRERVYIRLALGTGQRPGAICELRWDQVDTVNETIDFRTNDVRKKRRALVTVNAMVKEALALAKAHTDGDYILHWSGKHLKDPRWMVRELSKAAKIPDVTPHVFRHTVASLLLQGGEDLLKVSRLLGHSSTHITETVYFQHPPSWLKDTTSKLKF